MEPARLLDFEIQIEAARADGLYPVEVLRAPGGEATGTLDTSSLSTRAREPRPPDSVHEARTLGAELFEALLQGELRIRFDVSRELAAAQQAGLRLRLRLEPPELVSLPWELLFDTRSDEFIALSRTTPIVRYLPAAAAVEPLAIEPPLRILALAAGPGDLPPVDRLAERARMNDAVARLQRRRAVELVWIEGQTARDLQTTLQDGPFHILHYVGHARWNDEAQKGELVLADDEGLSAPLPTGELVSLLGDQSALRLVVLNACEGARSDEAAPFSSLAAALVQSGLPGVVAMQYEITTEAASEFTRSFYGALAAALPVDAAVSEARKAMRQAAPTSVEWATPVLYLRAPDGALWETQPVRRPVWTYAVAAISSALLLLGLWVLINWVVVPWLFPSQMNALFNIAVADIGIKDETGRMVRSDFGSSISEGIYDELNDVYRAVDGSGTLADDVLIWHDSLGRAQKNVRFGMIEGATAEERAEAARTLADHIQADMVVYGYLTPLTTRDELTLEFFYASPARRGEPQATAGNQSFGGSISSSVPASIEPTLARQSMDRPLSQRVSALVYITRALIYRLLDEPETAWEVLKQGEAALAGWPDEQGRDLYYLFQGEAALYARRYNDALVALDKALAINPHYVNAMLLKGSVYMDRAQLFYLRGRTLTAEEQQCTSTDHIDSSAPTLEDAARDAHEAVRLLEEAALLAPQSAWPPIEMHARMNLALAYRLAGQTFLYQGKYAEADRELGRAGNEFDRVLTMIDPALQPQYIGWAQAGLGITQRLQAALHTAEIARADAIGDLSLATQHREESLRFLRSALVSYQACLDLREETLGNLVFQQQVLICACEPYAREAQSVLATMEAATPPPTAGETAPHVPAQGDTP